MKLNGYVIVKDDLVVGDTFDGCRVTDAMKNEAGKIAEIVKIDVDGTFKLDIDNGMYSWTKEMVNDITPKELKEDCRVQNKYLKKVMKDVITNLGCLEETGNPQVDSYTDDCLRICKKVLKECE